MADLDRTTVLYSLSIHRSRYIMNGRHHNFQMYCLLSCERMPISGSHVINIDARSDFHRVSYYTSFEIYPSAQGVYRPAFATFLNTFDRIICMYYAAMQDMVKLIIKSPIGDTK